jgi:hypothetical protein
VLVLLLLAGVARAEVRHPIHFPDLPDHKTLACDLHMHTVFSDGQVWPPVRVAEAWRQGLDAIAIADHIEYQPHKDDVPTKLGRSYELALDGAKTANVLLIRAAEITRDTPPGHFNAMFLDDVKPLATEDFVDAVGAANKQGAFVFWNHHGWKGEEKGRWLDVHTTLYEKKWLHGMEVCNGDSYYPSAHQWCLDKNLTMVGNTDIHEPDLRRQSAPGDHRTMTLVFAKDRTPEALKEALFAGRTAVWFNNQIIGRPEWLAPLLDRCLRVAAPHLRSKNAVWVEIENVCDVDIQLDRVGNVGPTRLALPAGTISLVKIDTPTPGEPLELAYTAANFLIAPGKGLPVTLRIAGETKPK